MKLIRETTEYSEIDGTPIVIIDRLFEDIGVDEFGMPTVSYLPQRLTLLKSTYEKVRHETIN